MKTHKTTLYPLHDTFHCTKHICNRCRVLFLRAFIPTLFPSIPFAGPSLVELLQEFCPPVSIVLKNRKWRINKQQSLCHPKTPKQLSLKGHWDSPTFQIPSHQQKELSVFPVHSTHFHNSKMCSVRICSQRYKLKRKSSIWTNLHTTSTSWTYQFWFACYKPGRL